MTEEFDTIIVGKESAGIRLDRFLADSFCEKSRSYFQYLIDEGCVLINGEKTKKREITKENDEIEILFRASEQIDLIPENIPLDILYEDEDILAINKPAKMVVHPAAGNWQKTLVHALLFHCQNLEKQVGSLRPGIVHRLDKDTTGVLLAAKKELAQQRLIEQFSRREVDKSYLAICLKRPKEGLFTSGISRHKTDRKKMCVSEGGKEAKSFIKVLAEFDPYYLVFIKIFTGRTHQVRVHLSHLQSPILGDALYGSEKINSKLSIEGQLLHAFQIEFTHPTSKKKMSLQAPLPEGFLSFLQREGFDFSLLSNLVEDAKNESLKPF